METKQKIEYLRVSHQIACFGKATPEKAVLILTGRSKREFWDSFWLEDML